MTIRHIKIFVTVYQTGSVTRAAEKLYMTQPAVTRAIKDMERYYGVLLFERINQRLSVTEAGKQLYNYALHIMDSFDHMEMGLRKWDEEGAIRVGASATLGSILLPKVLKEFRKQRSSITVRTVVTNGTRLQGMLENNELDFALIEGSVSAENLLMEEFSEDRLILLMPLDCELLELPRLRLRDLQSYPLLLREEEIEGESLLNHVFALQNMTLSPIMKSVSTHAIIQSVHEGLGISFLPERLVRHSVESGFVVTCPVADETFRRKNYIVRHKNKMLTHSAEAFIALCHRLAPEMD